MKISVSVLAGELVDLKRSLEEMDPKIVDLIHLDIMDGHFVPQLSFGEAYSREIGKVTKIPLDVHLMVSQPEKEVPKYFDLRPQILSFHIEATHAPVRLAQSIRSESILAGIALNPGTPVETLKPLLDTVDLFLLMSVEPGYYGQKFLEDSIQKAVDLRALIGERKILVEMDGGIGPHNIGRLKDAGVDIVVSGASCFRSPHLNANVEQLRKSAQSLSKSLN